MRANWEQTWARMAVAISQRSLCDRAQVGAVIVTPTNRVVSVGYNGAPAGFPHYDKPCREWCPRGAHSPGLPIVDREYNDCNAAHAEQNALMAADRSTWEAGTIYVLGDVCFTCAKLIANSGLAKVVVIRDGDDREYRKPDESYRLLRNCGIEVQVL